MAMICPECNGTFTQQAECLTCSRRSGIPLHQTPVAAVGENAGWQQKPLGRIFIGILLAQGLAHGLRMAVDAGFLGASQQAAAIWSSMTGHLLMQGMQGIGLVIAGALAGAGQLRGYILGAFVGLLNSILLLSLQMMNNHPMSEAILYGQPLLHVFCGALGGLLGSLIWKPLPEIKLARPVAIQKGRRGKSMSQFAGPIAWGRVFIGTIIVTAGTIFASFILEFVVRHSRGELQLSSPLQIQMVIWEITALAVVLGAGFAGMNTFNGLKQGLCVGLAAGWLAAGYKFYETGHTLEEIVFTGLFILGLSLAGGWFGCKLFPPVVAKRRSVPTYS